MANPSKQKGTAAETAVVHYLRTHGYPRAERRALSGSNDKGDVSGVAGVVIEVKAEKAISVAAWLKEAEAERANAGADVAVVWRKAPGKTDPGKWHVIMTGEQFVRLLLQADY